MASMSKQVTVAMISDLSFTTHPAIPLTSLPFGILRSGLYLSETLCMNGLLLPFRLKRT